MLNILKYNNNQIRMMEKDGEYYWVAGDVCKVLNLNNITKALERVDKDDLTKSKVVDELGRKQNSYIINESGLYSLILTSEKDEAKTFKRWITKEVLPTLRKSGSYSLNNKDTYTYYTSDLISKDLNNLDIVRMDDNYNKERPCYWCPTICTCGHCGLPKHFQVDQKNSLNLHCIFEKVIRSEIDKNYKQYDLLHKVIYDLVKTNRQIDWEVGFNRDFLQRICDLAFIGYKAKYRYDNINNKPEEVKKRLCMA